jgi:hypothetical protein
MYLILLDVESNVKWTKGVRWTGQRGFLKNHWWSDFKAYPMLAWSSPYPSHYICLVKGSTFPNEQRGQWRKKIIRKLSTPFAWRVLGYFLFFLFYCWL